MPSLLKKLQTIHAFRVNYRLWRDNSYGNESDFINNFLGNSRIIARKNLELIELKEAY